MAVDEGETPASKRAKDVLILNPGNTITPARVYRVTENNGFFIPWSCIMGKIPILTKPPTGPRELVKFKTARVQIVINTPPEFDFEGANWPINLIWIIDLPRPLLVGSGYEALHVMFDKPGDFWKGGEVLWESEYWNAYRAWPLMEREDDGKIRGIVVDGREYPLIPDKHDGGDIQEVEVDFWEVSDRRYTVRPWSTNYIIRTRYSAKWDILASSIASSCLVSCIIGSVLLMFAEWYASQGLGRTLTYS